LKRRRREKQLEGKVGEKGDVGRQANFIAIL